MVKEILASKTIKIPENVEVQIEGKKVSVKGPLGVIKRDFSHAILTIKKNNDELCVEVPWPDKKGAASVGTISSLIKNMIIGVVKGFTYKLKIVFAHFPMSVKVGDKEVIIENFGGERMPRRAKIQGDVKVTIVGDDVILQGIDVMDVSQTAANIQQASHIKKKDPRVFLDGVYIFERKE
ncbi:MAG: large subunit ribosomal protein [Thermoproteota archaeon]|nr:large subunit ribosomal protein [Thermoproteota archaeon]